MGVQVKMCSKVRRRPRVSHNHIVQILTSIYKKVWQWVKTSLRRFLHTHGNITREGSPNRDNVILLFRMTPRVFIAHSTIGSKENRTSADALPAQHQKWAKSCTVTHLVIYSMYGKGHMHLDENFCYIWIELKMDGRCVWWHLLKIHPVQKKCTFPFFIFY